VLDPIFKKVGLSGKSVIPLVVGTGCSVPGIMACRTIRDERERRATAMLTPFIPCGAKIPVIALFAGAFFPESKWVSPVMYFVGILLVLLGGLLVKAITGYKYRKSYFIIELPEYKIPSLVNAVMVMFSRAKSYIIKAGTIILVCNAVVSIMASYTWTFTEAAENASNSILASIAHPISVLLIPLGFGTWKFAAAAVTGFIAKEDVVGTLATVFAISVEASEGKGETMFGITAVAGLAYLMFNLYTPPCFAAIGAMNAEIKSKKWLFAGIGLQFAVGYIVAFLVYQVGTLIVDKTVGEALVPGIIAVAAIIAAVTILSLRTKKKTETEYANKAKAK
ncbi:MAG: ferrous iron transporter B, partial [Lachnospiraceae bacterium]|nr:ferrous iron transporter B [Lachnospiraceae bacterium]